MERTTQRIGTGYRATPDAAETGAAMDRLGKFEDLWQSLELEQQTLGAELARLRAAGQQNTVKFRELMVKKLNNATMLAAFAARGL